MTNAVSRHSLYRSALFSACSLFYMKKLLFSVVGVLLLSVANAAEPIEFGDFESWMTRHIHESPLLGGAKKTVYAVAPERTVEGNHPYCGKDETPWATSNVMANVCGIIKTSNTVYPEVREDGGLCACMKTVLEECRVLGVVNLKVLVSGTVYLGYVLEPIRSTNDPYSKMEMGIPFDRRPTNLVYDYKVKASENDYRTFSNGFSPMKQVPGRDSAEVYVFLQHRWEDADGNVYAKRVGTGRERYWESTDGWVNGHRLPIYYGDITGEAYYQPYMDLLPEDKWPYTTNSRGRRVKVQEIGWADPDEPVTHMMLMASAACGTAFIGSIGNTFWIDNVALEY